MSSAKTRHAAEKAYSTDLDVERAQSIIEFEFPSIHGQLFESLVSSMLSCARQLRIFSVTQAILSWQNWDQRQHASAVLGLANCLNHLAAASLIATGARRFQSIYTTSGGFQICPQHVPLLSLHPYYGYKRWTACIIITMLQSGHNVKRDD